MMSARRGALCRAPIFGAILALSPARAMAWEVTYQEFSGGYLNATISTTTAKSVLECRVEVEGRPIGSGMGSVHAGVALVLILMPSAMHTRLADFKYFCVE